MTSTAQQPQTDVFAMSPIMEAQSIFGLIAYALKNEDPLNYEQVHYIKMLAIIGERLLSSDTLEPLS